MLEACRGVALAVTSQCVINSFDLGHSLSGREGHACSQSAEARTCRLERDTRSGTGVHKVVR